MGWNSTSTPTAWPLTWRPDGTPDLYFKRPDPRVLRLPIRRPTRVITTFMVGGEPFVADVTNFKTLAPGEFKGWSMMKGATRDILGCHVDHTVINKDLREVVVTVSNSAVSVTKPFPGAVYYQGFSVSNARGWNVYAPRTSWSGPTALFPAFQQVELRFILYRGSVTLAEATAAFNGAHFDSAEIERFGPSRTQIKLLPGADDGQYVTYGPVEYQGDPVAGAHAGKDIYPFPRTLSIPDHRRKAAGNAARHRANAYDAETGAPYQASRWGTFEYDLSRGNVHNARIPYFNGGTVNDYWTERFFNPGICSDEIKVQTRRGEDGFAAFDRYHMCRGVLDDLALWYRTRSWASWYRLQCAAQDIMTSDRMIPIGVEVSSNPNDWIPYSMHQRTTAAQLNPGRGGDILRGEGWPDWIVAQVSWITPPGPVKDYMMVWMTKKKYLHTLTTPQNGIPYNGRYPWSDDGIPWQPQIGFNTAWGDVPSWQIPIWVAGYDELCWALNVETRFAADAADGYLMGSVEYVQSEYNSNAFGPPYYLRTSVNGAFDAPISFGSGRSNPIHFRDHLARAFFQTLDEQYLETAIDVDFPRLSVADLKMSVLNTQDPWAFRIRDVLVNHH